MENENYELISELAWKALVKWYGGGPPITRKVIRLNTIKKTSEVEVYPMEIAWLTTSRFGPYDSPSRDPLHVSKALSVAHLRTQIAQIMNTPPHSMKLWMETPDGLKEIVKENFKDQIFNVLACCKRLIVDISTNDRLKPHLSQMEITSMCGLHSKRKETASPSFIGGISSKPKTSNDDASENPYHTRSSLKNPGRIVIAGTTGLENLGNTCFMNSALQCLAHTTALTQYFLEDHFLSEINEKNPLGTQGKMARSYADLIKNLWSGTVGSVSPYDFKHVLSLFAPQFSGYRQHDSHELLAFLLDGLHEDMNRITNKPYIETQPCNPDDKIASEESWKNHLKRNQSIIVDLFQGQLKSTLVCPECTNISITFDPFMYLSLPLPIVKDRFVPITLVRNNGNCFKLRVRVGERAQVLQLKEGLVSMVPDLQLENVIMADVSVAQHKIDSKLPDDYLVSKIRFSDDTFAYEVEKNSECVFKCLHKRKSGIDFGIPFFLCFPKNSTNNQIHEILFRRISHLIDPDTFQIESVSVKMSTEMGNSCVCGNFKCHGCVLPRNDDVQEFKANTKFVIVWEVPTKEEQVVTHPSCLSEKNIALTLDNCFQVFLEQERLGPQDTWYCPKCKTFQQAMKKFDIFRIPEVLVVHLKRFQYGKHTRDKLDVRVNFPSVLDVAPFVDGITERTQYKLFGTSNHFGGLGGGHYTAYAQTNERWYSFNDSEVRTVDPNSVIGAKEAYLLFYQRIA
eukprot:TRINITY_DN3689_c0_g2_i1.p1 TRINITY_DN3689_c0_g2~~TRINITY_DN3689_c0_g2_i1.p1  ORF type:complete len:826 (-),score=209.35 TRINITY_DN3689_c0_g2_i1:13-2226(-)